MFCTYTHLYRVCETGWLRVVLTTGVRDYFLRPAKILPIMTSYFVAAGMYKIEELFDFDKTSVCESDVRKIVFEIGNVRRNIILSC